MTELRNVATPDADLFTDAVERFRNRQYGLGLSKDMVETFVDQAKREVKRGLVDCESPLERRTLPYLVTQDYHTIWPTVAGVYRCAVDHDYPSTAVIVAPQFVFGRYRFDFALIARVGGKEFIVAVECDGKDFHNVANDARRDADCLQKGVVTVRAFGAAIYRGPRHLAERAANELLIMIDKAGLL